MDKHSNNDEENQSKEQPQKPNLNNSPAINSNTDRDIQLKVLKSKRADNQPPKQHKQDMNQYMTRLRQQFSLNQIQLIAPQEARYTQNKPMLKASKSCQTQLQQSKQAEQRFNKRKQITLFILNCICTLNVACENILFFFFGESQSKYYYLATSIIFMNLFFLLNSIYTAQNIKQLFCIAFLVDNILLTQIVASIGFVGLNMVYFTGKWQEYFSAICVPLLHFLLSANFRFLLLNYHWNRLKTITFKIVLLLGAIVLFGVGTYIMFINFKISKGLDPDIDSRFKDFTLLYTFGNFAFFGELYMKIGDFDKTGDLEFNYHISLETEEQTMQTEVDNQKIIGKMDAQEFIISQQKLEFRQKIKDSTHHKHIFL